MGIYLGLFADDQGRTGQSGYWAGARRAPLSKGPSVLEEKYFKWLILDELSDSDKTTSFNQRKIGWRAL